jgi:hypothetical protein
VHNVYEVVPGRNEAPLENKNKNTSILKEKTDGIEMSFVQLLLVRSRRALLKTLRIRNF